MKTNKILASVAAMAAAASAATCFDYSVANEGAGRLTADDSHYQDVNSAVTEALHIDNNWYPLAQELATSLCPNGDQDGDGVSDCYNGWNDADMLNTDGLPEVRVTLSDWVENSKATGSWGYTNGGLLYVLDGTRLDDPTLFKTVNIGSSITINAKVAAGKKAKVYLLESSYDSNNGSTGMHKAEITGSGSFQTYNLPKSSFSTWASNVANWAETRAIAVEYEIGSTQGGQGKTPEPFSTPLQEMLGWASLSVDGACTSDGSAVSKVASAKQVGFAALRNGLQFSNVGASTLNVQIFNTLGKVVASSKVTAKNSFVSTEALSNGVYVVRATDGAKLNMMRNVTVMR